MRTCAEHFVAAAENACAAKGAAIRGGSAAVCGGELAALAPGGAAKSSHCGGNCNGNGCTGDAKAAGRVRVEAADDDDLVDPVADFPMGERVEAVFNFGGVQFNAGEENQTQSEVFAVGLPGAGRRIIAATFAAAQCEIEQLAKATAAYNEAVQASVKQGD